MSTRELNELVGRIRGLTTARVGGRDPDADVEREVVLDGLLRDAVRVVLVASSVSASADGYSSRTPGNGSPGAGKGGGRQLQVRDEEGRPDFVPVSSTEAAVLEPFTPFDEVARIGGEVWAQLVQLDRVVTALNSKCAELGQLQLRSKVPEAPMCSIAASYGLPWTEEWQVWRTTTFEGRLPVPWPEARPVCKFAYWFVYNHRREPSKGEFERQLERTVRKAST